jgi:hypothetical protein
MNLKALTLSE